MAADLASADVAAVPTASVLDTLQDLSSIGLAALAFGALFVLLHALDRV